MSMRAVVWSDFGRVEVCDVPVPVPGPEEVLVQVKAATFCKTDYHMIEHGILGIDPPVIIGHEVAGIVVKTGTDAPEDLVGKMVALDPPVPCRKCEICKAGLRHMCPNTRHIGAHIAGGMAEYITIDYRNAYPVPAGVPARAASLAEPFATALEALERAGDLSGKTLVVLGDGPFGIIISRLASRRRGRVLLFGHHAARMALVRDYGVKAYDERTVDAGDAIARETGGYGADAVIDSTGSPLVLAAAVNWLRPRGSLVVFAPPAEPAPLDLGLIHFREIQVHGACRSLNMFPAALQAIAEDAAATEALVSRTLPIDEAPGGFDLLFHSKDDVVKAAIVFE